MDLEYFMFSFQIGNRELYLSIDSSWTNQSRIKSFNFVGGHDDFYFCMSLKAIKLIQQL